MVTKIIENSAKNLKLPLFVFDNFDASFVDQNKNKVILAFFDDSIPNITGVPPLEYEKILIHKRNSQPIKGFDHYIKKPFLPTEIVNFIKPKIPQDLTQTSTNQKINSSDANIMPDDEILDHFELDDLDLNLKAKTSQEEQTAPKEDLLEEIHVDFQALEHEIMHGANIKDNTFVASDTQEIDAKIPDQEQLDFDDFFENKADEHQEEQYLDHEMDAKNFLENLDLDTPQEAQDQDSKNPQDENSKAILQEAQDQENKEELHLDEDISNDAIQILNPQEVDEVKRLLEETSKQEDAQQIKEDTSNHQDFTNPQVDTKDTKDIQDIQDAQDIQDIQDAQDAQDAQDIQDIQDIQEKPKDQQYLKEDFALPFGDLSNDIENLDIDESEILEALNQTHLPKKPLKQEHFTCDGKDFIAFIKNTPQEQLETIFSHSKVFLEIDFTKQ